MSPGYSWKTSISLQQHKHRKCMSPSILQTLVPQWPQQAAAMDAAGKLLLLLPPLMLMTITQAPAACMLLFTSYCCLCALAYMTP
jgi:hypothetical protein